MPGRVLIALISSTIGSHQSGVCRVPSHENLFAISGNSDAPSVGAVTCRRVGARDIHVSDRRRDPRYARCPWVRGNSLGVVGGRRRARDLHIAGIHVVLRDECSLLRPRPVLIASHVDVAAIVHRGGVSGPGGEVRVGLAIDRRVGRVERSGPKLVASRTVHGRKAGINLAKFSPAEF